jgi:hypothetical protein
MWGVQLAAVRALLDDEGVEIAKQVLIAEAGESGLSFMTRDSQGAGLDLGER